jgi:hypothetical protein
MYLLKRLTGLMIFFLFILQNPLAVGQIGGRRRRGEARSGDRGIIRGRARKDPRFSPFSSASSPIFRLFRWHPGCA